MGEFHSIEIITMPRLNNLINEHFNEQFNEQFNEHFSWKMFSNTGVRYRIISGSMNQME